MLVGLRFGVGIGSGLFWPSSLELVRVASPFRGFPTAVGVYNASGGFGVLSGLVLGLSLEAAIGWRFALLMGGVIQLASALAMGVVVRDSAGEAAQTGPRRAPSRTRDVLHSRSLWSLTLAGVGVWGLGYIVPQYALAFAAADHPFWNLGVVALFVSMASLIGIPAGIAGGVLVSRSHRSRGTLAASALVMAAVGVAFPAFDLAPLGVLLAVFGLADGIAFTMLYSIPPRIPEVSPQELPLAIGILDSVQTLAGSGLAFAFGVIVGVSGFGAAWQVAAVIAALPLILLVWVRVPRERSEPVEPAA